MGSLVLVWICMGWEYWRYCTHTNGLWPGRSAALFITRRCSIVECIANNGFGHLIIFISPIFSASVYAHDADLQM